MLESLPVKLFVSTTLGFLAGIGIGGGSLLILWLTLVVGVPSETARAINLMFFVPCALIATAFRWKQAKADWHLTLPAVFAGLLGALLGNFWREKMKDESIRRVAGTCVFAVEQMYGGKSGREKLEKALCL